MAANPWKQKCWKALPWRRVKAGAMDCFRLGLLEVLPRFGAAIFLAKDILRVGEGGIKNPGGQEFAA